jgi:creatinine amidohydrolase
MKLEEMTAPEVRAAAAASIALLPIGAHEQHGAHLATSTDSAIVTAIAERVEAQLSARVVLCPTLPFGASHHHQAFGGTISFSVDVFARVVMQLVESLLLCGFKRVILLNGHGGNIIPASQALVMLAESHTSSAQSNIALATYWELAGTAFNAPPLESPSVRHGCEYETSLMLHLCPSRVQMDKAYPTPTLPGAE